LKRIKAGPYRKKPEVRNESAFESAREWASKNSAITTGVGVAVIALAILIAGIVAYVHSSEAHARSKYLAIAGRIPTHSGDPAAWNKVIPDLRAFLSHHGYSTSAGNARLELARGYFETKNYNEAVKMGEEALKSDHSGSGLRPVILYQLGFACEAAGKTDEAIKVWTELKNLGVAGMTRETEWNLGRLYQKKKDFASAALMFGLASQAEGDYPPTSQIEQKLAAVKITEKK
jgi:predicted negative regulator of RcsB-dependent stress response